jgi:hypothetical protein
MVYSSAMLLISIAKAKNRTVFGALKLEGYGDAYRKLSQLPPHTVVAPVLKMPLKRSKL